MTTPPPSPAPPTLLHTALPLEARPWIKRLNLKRIANLARWEVYADATRQTHLIVSGVGATRAAAAISAASAVFQPQRFLSFGVAGAPQQLAAVGDLCRIHAISDYTTGRAFYPDILEKHPFEEAALTTWPRRVTTADAPTTLVDMEAAGAWQAASAFLAPHEIVVFKVVSDHLTAAPLDITEIQGWLHSAVEEIAPWWAMRDVAPAHLSAWPEELTTAVEKLTQTLRLSASQHHQLRREAEDAFIRQGRLPAALQPTKTSPPTSKVARATALASLHAQLQAESI